MGSVLFLPEILFWLTARHLCLHPSLQTQKQKVLSSSPLMVMSVILVAVQTTLKVLDSSRCHSEARSAKAGLPI
jgi:hypothetical protein